MNDKKTTYLKYFLKNSPHSLFIKIFKKQKTITSFLNQNISLGQSSQIINDLIDSKKPFSIIRFGAVELSCINNYEKKKFNIKKKYKKSVKYSIKNNAGVFPDDEESLDRYSKLSLDCFNNVDVLAVSGIHMEDYFAKYYCSANKYIDNYALEPLLGDWVKSLKDKKVLVISPFAKQIEKQYELIDKIFPQGTIPKFSLLTVKAPLTLGENIIKDSNWFKELDDMEKQIRKLDFDIALIGCGAYGSHLASFVKVLGKQALQTGGGTQTMFGIMGKRWENRDYVSKYVNEYWVRPDILPINKDDVENGAYW